MNTPSSHEAIPRRSGMNWPGLALIGVIFGVVLIVAWNRCSQPALTDYEGVILDRMAGYRESEQGGQPHFRLLIQQDSGAKRTVTIDDETYHRARVGMKIRSRQGKIELTESQAKPNK